MRLPVQHLVAGFSLVALAGIGCSPALKANRVSIHTNSIDGLAVRVNAPHRVISVFRERPNSGAIVTYEETTMLPSSREIYVINYRGALFFDNELQVELHPSTTLKRVKVGSNSQVDEALKSLSDATANIGGTLSTLNPPAKTSGQQLTKEFCEEALKANLAAIAAHVTPLPYPSITTCQ